MAQFRLAVGELMRTDRRPVTVEGDIDLASTPTT
jgi:hypothetical protein